MSSIVIHAGEPTQLHVMVDALAGVGFGVVVVALYYVFLRYVVASNRGKQSGG
jgi:hypothetical protein